MIMSHKNSIIVRTKVNYGKIVVLERGCIIGKKEAVILEVGVLAIDTGRECIFQARKMKLVIAQWECIMLENGRLTRSREREPVTIGMVISSIVGLLRTIGLHKPIQ